MNVLSRIELEALEVLNAPILCEHKEHVIAPRQATYWLTRPCKCRKPLCGPHKIRAQGEAMLTGPARGECLECGARAYANDIEFLPIVRGGLK